MQQRCSILFTFFNFTFLNHNIIYCISSIIIIENYALIWLDKNWPMRNQYRWLVLYGMLWIRKT